MRPSMLDARTHAREGAQRAPELAMRLQGAHVAELVHGSFQAGDARRGPALGPAPALRARQRAEDRRPALEGLALLRAACAGAAQARLRGPGAARLAAVTRELAQRRVRDRREPDPPENVGALAPERPEQRLA